MTGPVVDEDSLVPISFSKLNTFETCPRQYEAKYVTKTVPYQQTPEAEWGDYVHKSLENYIRYNQPLPANVADYQRFADAILAMRGQAIAERAVAINPYLMETGYFDGDVWIRAKIDVTVLRDDSALILDYKTGRMKDDPKQLMFYALLAFIMYPQVQKVQTGFIWLKDRVVSEPKTFTRDQYDQLLAMWRGKYDKLKEAHDLGVFPPKPNGLCNGWCEVTSCEHWKPKKGKR